MTETEPDVRWLQRLDHFRKTLLLLEETISIKQPSVAEKLGAVKLFEMTFELSWKLLKDYQEAQGFALKAPRAVIQQAFQTDLIDDGHRWLKALKARNMMIHTYDEEASLAVIKDIENEYLPLLKKLRDMFESKSENMEEA